MTPSDYTDCDIDKIQQIDNENYQNRYHNKSLKVYSSDVGKGPENIADLLKTKESKVAHKERSDTCAVPAASIICEHMLSFAITDLLLDKFGGDSMEQLKAHIKATSKY